MILNNIKVPRNTGNLQNHLKGINNLVNIEQKSVEWLDIRQNLITASSAYQIIPKTEKVVKFYNKVVPEKYAENPDPESTSGFFDSEYHYYKRKLGLETFTGNSATYFGEKYEDVSSYLYSKENSIEVKDYGILIHSEHPWLGGSPDGISVEGICLEIKTLYTRTMIDNYIPLKYYIQVQIMLEILDLEECHYLETKIEEFTSFIPFWKNTDPNNDKFGVVKSTNQKREYLYNPTVLEVKNFTTNNDLEEVTFFKVLKNNKKVISRDRGFFNEIFPYLERAYNTLLQLKNGEKRLEDLNGYENIL